MNINLHKVSIIFLPLNSTSKHQLLELGLIAASKILYRTALVDATLEVLERYQASEYALKINSGRGNWGLEESQLHHVADAIKLSKKAWSLTSRQSVIRSWLKSGIIGVNHQNQLQLILNGISRIDHDFDIDLTGRNEYDSFTSLDDSEIINSTIVKNVREAIQAYELAKQNPNSSIASTIEEALVSVT